MSRVQGNPLGFLVGNPVRTTGNPDKIFLKNIWENVRASGTIRVPCFTCAGHRVGPHSKPPPIMDLEIIIECSLLDISQNLVR